MRTAFLLLRLAVWTGIAAVALLMTLVAYDSLRPPVSTLMLMQRLVGKPVTREPVSLSGVSPRLIAAVLMSEDAQFCHHDGVDWDALSEVMSDPDGPQRGASTITMQTAKNLFLWPGRSYVRKALEIPTALLLDALWSKKTILTAYLNVAEWGDGIFGAEAASRFYYRKPAAQLSAREAALLAAALPNPHLRNPQRPNRVTREHAATVLSRMQGADPWLQCLR